MATHGAGDSAFHAWARRDDPLRQLLSTRAARPRQSERRFRLLAEAIPQIVWTRPDGYCDFQNRRWFDYSGLTREESSGTGWLDAVHPEDRGSLQPRLVGGPHDGPAVRARVPPPARGRRLPAGFLRASRAHL